jgi:hypothetical protein
VHSSGSSSPRTTLGDARAIQPFQTLELLAHLTASQPTRLIHSMPLFTIFFLLSLLSLPSIILPFTHFLPPILILASPFPQQTTSVPADPSQLLRLTVCTHAHAHYHRSTNFCQSVTAVNTTSH